MGSFHTRMKREGRHKFKWTFFDHQRREYTFKEEEHDRLLIYPSKETVAEGKVTSIGGTGKMKIMDIKKVPELPLLFAVYAAVLQKQEEARRLGFSGGSW